MSRTGTKVSRFLLVAVAVLGVTVSASAAPITGTLNITGSVQVNQTTIDWIPIAGGEGIFNMVFPGTEYFADIYNPAVNPPYIGSATDLVGQALPLANFLNDFQTPDPTYSDLSFTLTDIVDPTAPTCTGSEGVNQTCSLGSFTLTQTATGVAVSFNVAGFFIDPTEGDFGSNLATGVYTTQLNTPAVDTIAEVRAILLSGNSIQSSYSATYTVLPTPIPEPATLVTFGTGSFLLAAHKRRKMNKNKKA